MMEDIRIWKGRIGRALSVQQEQWPLWKNSIDLYNCTYFERLYGGLDPERVDVHFANWYVDNMVALTYFRDPFLFIKGRSDRYSDFGDTMEKAVNTLWARLEMKRQMKRVIKSGFLMPPGWVKTGYTAKIGQDIAKVEKDEQKTLIGQIKDAIVGLVKKPKEELTPEEQGILNEYIEEESIFATWIPSWNILIPTGYQLVQNMPYLIEIEDVPKIDFMANPFYKNKNGVRPSRELSNKVSNSATMHKPNYQDTTGVGSDSETDIIRLYHIEDRRNRKRYTMSMESQDYHFSGDWYQYKDGFDYEPLIFEESIPSQDKSNPYPSNIILPILPQIIEQSASRTQMAKWRKRASAIILAQQGLASEEDLKKLSDTEAIQLVLVSNLSAFQMTQSPAMPQQVFEVDSIIKQDLQMGTSMGQMMFQAQSGQRTATQAQIGQSGLQLKAESRVDTVEDYTKALGKKLMGLLWNFYDRKKVSELIGEEVTAKMWPDPPQDSKERLQILHNELGLTIDAGSTAPPKDETVDRKQLLDFLSFSATLAPERLKKDEVIKAGIKRWKFVKDLDRIVISSDEDEKQKAMMENQLMLQGHPQTVGPNEPHDVHLNIHQQAAGNPLVDQHIIETGAKMGVLDIGKGGGGTQGAQQGGKPQSGDTTAPAKSIKPETTRESIPSQGQIQGNSMNRGVGVGQNGM